MSNAILSHFRSSSIHSDLSSVAHIQPRELVSLLPCRVYFRGGLHFFSERWENERAKAKFEVSLYEAPQTPAELLFYLRDGQVKQAACFFEISVRNVGVRTAEKVVPIVMIPKLLTLGVSLIFVSRPPSERTTIKGPWSVKDFKGDNVASAIIDNVAIKQVDLYGGGVGQRFALFFTLSDSDKVYFPCESKTSLRLPARFYLTLSFQAKDMPLCHSSVYEVDAKAWNDVSITEASYDPLQLLRTS